MVGERESGKFIAGNNPMPSKISSELRATDIRGERERERGKGRGVKEGGSRVELVQSVDNWK